MSKPIPHVYTGSTITLMYKGKTTIIDKSAANFTAVIDAIKKLEWDKVEQLANLRTAIALITEGRVKIMDDKSVYLNDSLIHDAIVNRMMEMIKDGFQLLTLKPLMRFMDRVYNNPCDIAKAELYLFLEACNLPITEDGYLLAYKVVGPDYKDLYTHTFDNSIGKECFMDRAKVDANRHRTCSDGLHACSESYIPEYHGHNPANHVVIVKIDPCDVVSIPSDYKNAKMRVCRYTVVDELENWQEKLLPKFYTKSYSTVVSEDEPSMDEQDESDDELFDEEDNATNDSDLFDDEESFDDGTETDSEQAIATRYGITVEKLRQIRKVRELGKIVGKTRQSIADETGLSRRGVGRILDGEAWVNVV